MNVKREIMQVVKSLRAKLPIPFTKIMSSSFISHEYDAKVGWGRWEKRFAAAGLTFIGNGCSRVAFEYEAKDGELYVIRFDKSKKLAGNWAEIVNMKRLVSYLGNSVKDYCVPHIGHFYVDCEPIIITPSMLNYDEFHVDEEDKAQDRVNGAREDLIRLFTNDYHAGNIVYDSMGFVRLCDVDHIAGDRLHTIKWSYKKARTAVRKEEKELAKALASILCN
jgi:hypothetical protein